eukprot:452356_1
MNLIIIILYILNIWKCDAFQNSPTSSPTDSPTASPTTSPTVGPTRDSLLSCGETKWQNISGTEVVEYRFTINSKQNVQFDSCQTQTDIVVSIIDGEGKYISDKYCPWGDDCGNCANYNEYYPENFTIPGLHAGSYKIEIHRYSAYGFGTYVFALNCIPTAPTSPPTSGPSHEPTPSPTSAPTNRPTSGPTPWPSAPTSPPIPGITFDPTFAPTTGPTYGPTNVPSPEPSGYPTREPTTAVPTPPPVDPPTYDGPENNEYFKLEFNKTIDELPWITCDAVYNDRTDIWNPVVYYRVNITQEMQNKYKSILQISTCCGFQKDCDQFDFVCNVNIWAQSTMGCSTVTNCSALKIYSESYDNYCHDSSLDTIVYLLYKKKGKIVLLDSFDDSSKLKCENTLKSSLNFLDYDDGQYIIGIGGFGKEFGSFTTKMICTSHSYPVEEHELNPSIHDKGSIECNQTKRNEIESMQYYRFDVTETSYFPIKIITCLTYSESRMYIIKRSEINGLGYDTIEWISRDRGETVGIFNRTDDESVLCNDMNADPEYSQIINENVTAQSSHFTLKLTDENVFMDDVKHFYIAIQPQPRSWLAGKRDKKSIYIYLRAICAPAPTKSPTDFPTRQPTHDPTIGPTREPTPAPTLEYSYPIKSAEYKNKIKENYPEIICGNAFVDQRNTHENLVSYYKFRVKNLYPDSYITVCPSKQNPYRAVIYVIQENGILYKSKYKSDDNCSVETHSMRNDVYYAVVQGQNNSLGSFTIKMECAEEKMPTEVVIALVCGIAGGFALGFLTYYIHQWRQYKKNKTQQSGHGSTALSQNDSDSERDPKDYHPNTGTAANVQLTSVNTSQANIIEHKENSDSDCESGPATITNDVSNQTNLLQAIIVNEDNKDDGLNRILDADKDILDELDIKSEEHVIQRVLRHAITSCKNQEGLDIYQVLAIRWYDKDESRTVKGSKPFKRIGWHIEVISISPFVRTLIIAAIIGFGQTMGISIVIYKLLDAYFSENNGFEDMCKMEALRWEKVFSLRILSFTLSLIVTCYITIAMGTIQHAGLYEILDRLKPEHMEYIENIALWLLYIGQGINYYACLVAVLGSYFIIFETNKGDDGDYSHAGSEMILNAVALFFMLQLDDEIVSVQDYNDCEHHLKRVLKNVTEEHYDSTTINEKYKEENCDNNNKCACNCKCNDVVGKVRRVSDASVSEIITASCCSQFMYRSITVISLVAKMCCYSFGFIAPFVIFVCW